LRVWGFELKGRIAFFLLVAMVGLCGGSMAAQNLPDAPSATAASLHGTVADTNGGAAAGAQATLTNQATGARSTATADDEGSFSLTGLMPGNYLLEVAANGFAPWKSPAFALGAGEHREVAGITLKVATTTDVQVSYTEEEMAEDEMRIEEKQRVLGVFPNFYVTYDWNAPPLSARQKFRLAARVIVDPMAFVGPAVVAGIEQGQNDFSGFGQGAAGFAKRYGASYGDEFTSTMIGGALFPALLRQDPRYFYKGTGSVRSRALYAISTVVICKGDNGHWQPNFSNVLGNLASSGISNFYYPASNRNGAWLTVDNSLIGTAEGAVGNLIQEFFLHRVTTRGKSTLGKE